MARTARPPSKRPRKVREATPSTSSELSSSPPSTPPREASKSTKFRPAIVKPGTPTIKHIAAVTTVKRFARGSQEEEDGEGCAHVEDQESDGERAVDVPEMSTQEAVMAIFANMSSSKPDVNRCTSDTAEGGEEVIKIHQPIDSAKLINTTRLNRVHDGQPERKEASREDDRQIYEALKAVDPVVLKEFFEKMQKEKTGRQSGAVFGAGAVEVTESRRLETERYQQVMSDEVNLEEELDEEEEREMEDRAEELCVALAAPFQRMHKAQTDSLNDILVVQMQGTLGKAVEPFQADDLKKQLDLWAAAEVAFKKRHQAQWDAWRKSHETSNAKMLQVLNKINAAHHLKRELVQKAEAECTQLREAQMAQMTWCVARQDKELSDIKVELDSSREKEIVALAKVTDKKSRNKDQQNAMQKLVASMDI